MNPVRLAVIGAGHLGRFHALIAARLPEIELVAVVDPCEEARLRVSAEADTRPVADYRLIADQIEAAIIATPTHTHEAIASDLLDRGVSLLVEKPLADNSRAAEALVERAAHHQVVLQVGHVERFNPAFRAIESRLSAPKYIEATRLSGYSFRSTDIGVVLDVMIHDLDLVLTLVRSPLVRVEALGVSVLGGHEDMATARLVFASGCVAQITASRVSFQQRREMQVFTDQAYAAIDFAAGRVDLVEPQDVVLRRELDFSNPAAADIAHWKEHLFDELLVRSTVEPDRVNAIEQEQLNLVSRLRHGTPLVVDGEAGRDAVAVAERILTAMDEHAWDGDNSGRRGPLAIPELPMLGGPAHWPAEEPPRRRAG